MRDYLDYFSEKSIAQILIRERLKRSRRRGRIQKIHEIGSEKITYELCEVDEQLQKYIPPRRTWVRPGPERRCRFNQNCQRDNCRSECKKRQNLNSDELAKISLNLTLCHIYRSDSSPYTVAIKELRDRLIRNITDKNFKFEEPGIIAIPKDIEKGIFRPIAQYTLEDKIVISLTNRYFTDLFDALFKDISFAFRSSQTKMNHHKAFEKIVDYNKAQGEKTKLWVSECDIQKFYDTVNHSIIKKEFKSLIKRVEKNNNDVSGISTDAQKIFYKYLDSYSFNKNVTKLNANNDYWLDKKGNSNFKHFGWITPKALKIHYIKMGRARIGIPQGGALSGLIANIVLNTIDEKIVNNPDIDKDLLYIRFCDDIVIMHPEKDKCSFISDIYNKSLHVLKLFPHPPSELSGGYSKTFWESKTKLCYCWSIEKDDFPWVGFVGYEINRYGHVRVRKKSIQKEIEKQRDWIASIIRTLKKSSLISIVRVENIAVGHLVGMSVGFFGIHNWQNTEKEMCWVNGFKCTNDNPYFRIQLRRLDRERNRQIAKLKRYLLVHSSEIEDVENEIINNKNLNRQIREHLGKPFSYFQNGLKGNTI